MLIKKFALFSILIFGIEIKADTVSLDHIFAKPAVKGGIPCEAFVNNEMAGGYLESPIEVYSSADLKNKKVEKVQPRISCVQGGGDCTCYLLYLNSVESTDGKSFFEIPGKNESPNIWVLADSKKAIDILKLATIVDKAEINFKDEDPEIYIDVNGGKKIKKSELQGIPKPILKKIESEIPAVIANLKISALDAKNGSISFWRSGADFNKFPKPTEKPFTEIYKIVSGKEWTEESKSFTWEVKVLKKNGNRYLVAMENSYFGNNVSSYSPEAAAGSPVFSWIELKGLNVKQIPIEKINLEQQISQGHPLSAGIVFSALKTETIKNELYTQFIVELLMTDPVKAEPNDEGSLKSKKYKLREIWIRSFDKDKRINFWLTTRPGC